MLIHILVCILLGIGSLCANPLPLTFHEFSKLNLEEAETLHNREITIRGFLYATQDGRWILSSEPNLKTCCVGSAHKAKDQIFLDSTFKDIPSSGVVQVQGLLMVVPQWDDKQTLLRLYQLKNARTLEEKERNQGFLFGVIGMAFLGILGLLWVFTGKKTG